MLIPTSIPSNFMQASIFNLCYPGLPLRIVHFALCLFFAAGFTSCTKDENAERDYPRVNTIEVGRSNTWGTLVSAEIISGNPASVTEYGFVWSTDEYPYADEDDKQFKTGAPSGHTFSDTIRPNLTPNETYYVRAYIKTGFYIVHGNILSFRSQ